MRDYQNPWQSARERTGQTQEQAAELLGISVKSLQHYEQEITTPSPVMVDRMAIAYHAPWLRNHYCNTCPLGCRWKRPEDSTDLRELAIQLQLEVGSGQQMKDARRLLEIAKDGRIDDREKPEYLEIVGRLYRSAYLAEMAVILRDEEIGQ